jgi:hypothetical protein
MLAKVVACLGLLAITVVVHSTGLVALLRWVLRSPAQHGASIGRSAWLLVRVVWILMALHALEIGVWAAFYWWRGAMPDVESAAYFSATTYATIGYGDLVLPVGWRLLGSIEGLTGILMCGLSISFFFAVLSRRHGVDPDGAGVARDASPASSSNASATRIRRPK